MNLTTTVRKAKNYDGSELQDIKNIDYSSLKSEVYTSKLSDHNKSLRMSILKEVLDEENNKVDENQENDQIKKEVLVTEEISESGNHNPKEVTTSQIKKKNYGHSVSDIDRGQKSFHDQSFHSVGYGGHQTLVSSLAQGKKCKNGNV